MRRNAQKNQKENSIYFVSLVITIVAFYVVLSLGKQDVITFLRQMESQAVNSLLGLANGVYAFSLIITFFLIFFAQKYQLERRSHEYGMLLMLGMKRSRLFLWLLAEDVYSSMLALLIGLPMAVFLSEIIALVTAKLIGLGILSHQLAISPMALGFTAAGFIGIKLVANILLSFQMVKREPYHLMNDTQEEKQKVVRETRSLACFISGVVLLAVTYGIAIGGITWKSLAYFSLTLALGAVGTWLFLKGFCAIFSKFAKGRIGADRLHIFTFRQLQENVFLRSGSLTISSLLVLVAITCMSYGIAVSVTNLQDGNRHSMDYTFAAEEEETAHAIQELKEKKQTQELIAGWAGVQVAYLPTKEVFGEDTDVPLHEYDATGLLEAVQYLGRDQRKYIEGTSYRESPHVINLSGINALHQQKGEAEITLKPDEVLIYIDPETYPPEEQKIYEEILRHDPWIKIDDKKYRIKAVCSEDIVVDRSITIGFGLVLPDQDFMEYVDEKNVTTYWNAYLSKSLIEEKGLMKAIMEGNAYFNKSGLFYENYLQNMGRQLFYIVAASYLTIYLALIFLIIANTVISLQYLMQEKKSRRRYQTLICLGSTYQAICASAKRQIRWYFGVPLGVAALSSIFAVLALFSGILPSSLQDDGRTLSWVAATTIILLCVIEYVYVKMVMRMSSQNLSRMMEIRRRE